MAWSDSEDVARPGWSGTEAVELICLINEESSCFPVKGVNLVTNFHERASTAKLGAAKVAHVGYSDMLTPKNRDRLVRTSADQMQ